MYNEGGGGGGVVYTTFSQKTSSFSRKWNFLEEGFISLEKEELYIRQTNIHICV